LVITIPISVSFGGSNAVKISFAYFTILAWVSENATIPVQKSFLQALSFFRYSQFFFNFISFFSPLTSMTEEQIKEALSNNYIGTLASVEGFKLTKATDTGGVDYSVSRDLVVTNAFGEKRYIQAGNYIDIQLKSTTTKRIIESVDTIQFDLEAKSYNDLIMRRDHGAAPLILVVFILPQATHDWVEVDEMNLMLRHRAYWYRPAQEERETSNRSSIRITISKQNRFLRDTWPKLYEQFFK